MNCNEKPAQHNLKEYFQKTYLVKNLLDEDWENRSQEIEKVSKEFGFIPKVTFERTVKNGEVALVYRQRRIQKLSCNKNMLSLSIATLAQDLDALSATGFIHGDINRKNLVFDGTRYCLVDLEPSLKQRKNNVDTLMMTSPYISLNDLNAETLTTETDKIGFYFFCRKALNPNFKLSTFKEIEKVKSGKSIIEKYSPFLEEAFVKMSFADIYKVAQEKSAITIEKLH